MTVDEIANTLPHGFHDSRLAAFTFDVIRQEARLTLDIWVGDMSAASDAEREMYRPAELTVTGMQFCVCDPEDRRAWPPPEAGESVLCFDGIGKTQRRV